MHREALLAQYETNIKKLKKALVGDKKQIKFNLMTTSDADIFCTLPPVI